MDQNIAMLSKNSPKVRYEGDITQFIIRSSAHCVLGDQHLPLQDLIHQVADHMWDSGTGINLKQVETGIGELIKYGEIKVLGVYNQENSKKTA